MVEIDYLRVFPAQLNGHVGFRNEGLHGGFARNDLLHEFHAQPLRQQKPARPGDGNGHGLLAESAACVRRGCGSFFQHFHDSRAHVGMVAPIHGKPHGVVLIENGQLHGGGANVDADAQILMLAHDSPYSLMGSPGLMKKSRSAMRAISCELSPMPVSIQCVMTPRYADA